VVDGLTIYEVGPRDGLQGLDFIIPTAQKIELIQLLYDAGLTNIEVGSFVNPRVMPTMADSDLVFANISHIDGQFGVLIPNQHGLIRAKQVGVTHFNIFFSPSDEFNHRNLGRVQSEVIDHYWDMLKGVPRENVRVYISCAFGCPFMGSISDNDLSYSLQQADLLGGTIVLCDTVGKATPELVESALMLTESMNANIALHLHYGDGDRHQMLRNIETAWDYGVRQFDSSIGGLGGCPLTLGSGHNLATEDLVAWCEDEGIDCGVSTDNLKSVLSFIKRLEPMEVYS